MLKDFSEPYISQKDILSNIPTSIFNPLLWLFLGGDGTGTALHYDVLSTHAWLAVIAGRKRVALHAPADFSCCFTKRVTESSNVLRNRCSSKDWLYLEVNSGDLIFIPSEWWRVVVNEGPTIGLTRNFATLDISEKVKENAKLLNLTQIVSCFAK